MQHDTRRTIIALLLCCGSTVSCLSASDILQPELAIVPGVPAGWAANSTIGGIGTTATDVKSGAAAAYLSSAGQVTFPSYVMSQFIRADTYRGKRVRFSAWLKPRNVSNVVSSGLWMRVDGPGTTLAFDNMSNRPVTGAGDWRKVSIVLDVPEEAIGIAFGALFRASNTLLIDDMAFEVVNTDVPVTNTLGAPTNSGIDSAATVANYVRSSTLPVNLDFEGIAPLSQTTVDWLSANSTPLATTDPAASLDDLEPLRAMVGTAHIVGLGEATHGTKEFFRLKHRMLRFLVTQMGFTTFAIEATSPEADDINRYVLTGVGDPARLLSRLYFWTWNTQEVLEQILWMRQWNSTAPANQRVQFRGIDIQSPGASMDSVSAFLKRVDPQLEADVALRYACLEPYRNRAQLPGRPQSEYALLAESTKQDCAASVGDAYVLMRVRGEAQAGFQTALHHARLVQQFEHMATSTNAALLNRRRDSAMAENVEWIRDQAVPDAKIVVWAHNAHIARQTNFMGRNLHVRYGTDYRALGFLFGQGQFNAVLQKPDDSLGLPQSHDVTYVAPTSIEELFLRTSGTRLLFDARRAIGGGVAAAPLLASFPMREVGSAFQPGSDANYFIRRFFPADFDLLVFVRSTTASTLRTAVY